jgi:hypothetical protein
VIRFCVLHDQKEELTDLEDDRVMVMFQIRPGQHCLQTMVQLSNGRYKEQVDAHLAKKCR